LYGEGVFPRISLDLPRIGDEEGHYSSMLKEAREMLCKDSAKECESKDAQCSHRSGDEVKPCITLSVSLPLYGIYQCPVQSGRSAWSTGIGWSVLFCGHFMQYCNTGCQTSIFKVFSLVFITRHASQNNVFWDFIFMILGMEKLQSNK
jgi:hypothetical protein